MLLLIDDFHWILPVGYKPAVVGNKVIEAVPVLQIGETAVIESVTLAGNTVNIDVAVVLQPVSAFAAVNVYVLLPVESLFT